MKVWKVRSAAALSPTHGQVCRTDGGLARIVTDVRLHWWDRLRGITLQQKIEHEVLRQRAWCVELYHQERERAKVNEELSFLIESIETSDRVNLLHDSKVEKRKI